MYPFPLTGYSILHLVIAGICALMALVHLALWLVVRADRVQLWCAIAFAGFFLLNVGIAGSGRLAAGGLGAPEPWLAVGVLSILPLWSGMLKTTWLMTGRTITRWRAALLSIAVGMAAVRTVDIAQLVARADGPITWERALNTTATLTVVPAWLMTLVVGVVCIAEAVRDLGRRSAISVLLLVTTVPATILVTRELFLTFGWVGGPTWLGTSGLPFVFTASAIVVSRYAQAMRQQVRGEEEAKSVGGYRLIRRIDAGGMGELFLATRTGPHGFERNVALKRILVEPNTAASELKDLNERFLDEARLAAQLDHPNIVAVSDLGRLDGGWFLAMEYLSGVTLLQVRDRFRERGEGVPPVFVATVGEQVCRGLAYAHRNGVLHRDISPQNVMVTFDGGVKIIDFGIAVAKGGGIPRGERGMIVGKGPYLAPERLRGEQATASADLYALGVVLYELLAGFRPYRGATPTDIARSMKERPRMPVSAVVADLNQDLAEIVERALETSPSLRYQEAEEMARDLARLVEKMPRITLGDWTGTHCARDLREQKQADLFGSAPIPRT